MDRKEEWRRLDRLRGAGLAVLWGRRRVGKTRLLVEWSRARDALYTVADLSAETIQRRYFAEAIASRVPGFAEAVYPDWRALFNALARAAAAGRVPGPIIIDELPYLITTCPSLPSTLQAFVDHEAQAAGLLLVVAGSSQHMMHGLVLDASAPLYGRAQAAFEILPLSAGYLGEALGLDRATDVVGAYALWGGIPRYWEMAESFGADIDTAVAELVLDPAGPLHREPDRLLADEQPNATVLRPILDAIGAGAHRLSEIASRIGRPASALSRPLRALQDLGLVRREVPYGVSPKTSKRSLYRIADPFLRFWFRVVAPRRGLLVAAPPSTRIAVWSKHKPHLLAEAWEELCRRAVPHLGPSLDADGPFGPATRFWWGNEPEWDIVAESVDGTTLLLGECKWFHEPATEKLLDRTYRELARKGVPKVVAGKHQRIIHVVFVPEAPPAAAKRPYVIVEAQDVLAALR
ncbi:MAG: ATP-binding protein [Deltaproteobacteria bacterium]|nr:ATP-binding protein [Deltaproteobacteria bacterium]